MSKRQVVTQYLTGFCAGDVERVAATLADEFELDGPLFTFRSKQEYLASLAGDFDAGTRFEIVELLEGVDTVSVFYDYAKPSGTVTVAQLFWFENSKIRKTLLVFDRQSVG